MILSTRISSTKYCTMPSSAREVELRFTDYHYADRPMRQPSRVAVLEPEPSERARVLNLRADCAYRLFLPSSFMLRKCTISCWRTAQRSVWRTAQRSGILVRTTLDASPMRHMHISQCTAFRRRFTLVNAARLCLTLVCPLLSHTLTFPNPWRATGRLMHTIQRNSGPCERRGATKRKCFAVAGQDVLRHRSNRRSAQPMAWQATWLASRATNRMETRPPIGCHHPAMSRVAFGLASAPAAHPIKNGPCQLASTLSQSLVTTAPWSPTDRHGV